MQGSHANNELNYRRIVLDLLQRLTDSSIPRRYEEKVADFRHLDHDLTFEALRQLLQHADPEIRGRAGGILLQLDAHTTLEWVLPLLKDPNEYIRANICNELTSYGDSRAVDALIDVLLHDRNSDARFNAAFALGRIGDARAIPALEHAAEYDDGEDFEGRSITREAEHAIWEITTPPLHSTTLTGYTDDDLPW